MSLIFWAFVSFLASFVISLKPDKSLVQQNKEGMKFLIKYGYISVASGGTPPAVLEISSALKKAQKFGNIPITGIFDEASKKLFRSKRCGVQDVKRITKRKSQGWNKRRLTFSLENNSRTLTYNRVKRDLKKALDIWAEHSGLIFSEANKNGDIKAAFYVKNHGDGDGFDGPGGILAHAFPPGSGLGGDVHFDDDEHWITDKDLSFDVVALHELGHSLGLGHLPYRTSIMNPYYKKGTLTLSQEDIRNIKALYN